jgi:hypothetical protein
MIRRVAFKKAILAGVSGAIAWEAAVRVLIWLGLPLFDLVRVLGMMILGGGVSFWQWWLVGLTLHCIVGAIWAIFYAYFFWSIYDLRPALQGMIFSLLPTLLAGLIMIPQMDFMHPLVLSGTAPKHRFFALGIGWLGPVSVVLGHLIYGAVMGAIYTKPVGYAVGQKAVRYG